MPSIETTRLYYHDSYRWAFRTEVVESEPHPGGHAVVLETTYFYPNSGGQPNDLGRLGERTVVDVNIRESDGAVVHTVDGPLPLGPIEGTIDGARRLDHMQQHTGQHILSQAFLRVADATTIGFHLGRDYISIDLDVPTLTDSQREQAFAVANEVIRRDDGIKTWFPTEAELATIALRKTPLVEGALRVVAIGDFDVSACGGTHVARTGEVGLIHCLRLERQKRGTRVSFLAGDRAREDYAAKHRIVQTVSAALTCSVSEIPGAVERLQADLTAARRSLEAVHEEALDREAIVLARDAQPHGSMIVVRKQWTGRPAEDIKGLALRLTNSPNVIALLATTGERTQFVFSRPDASLLDLKPALNQALAAIGGGKGGGSRMVQGGGAAATPSQVEGALAAALATLPQQ